MIELTDKDLLIRLRNFEDPFVERKVESDYKDCLKTAVAFANSLPIGAPGVIFIPAQDDGTIQAGRNLDNLQKKISSRLGEAYPPIPHTYKVLGAGSEQVIALIVWGSEARPHFAGHSYVRDGSQSIKASEKQFAELIAMRQSKVYEILKWKDRTITVSHVKSSALGRSESYAVATLIACNQFFVTLKHGTGEDLQAISLLRISVSFDFEKNQLRLEVAES